MRYTIERFLFRLGKSAHRDAFLLKGATLFVFLGRTPTPADEGPRPTLVRRSPAKRMWPIANIAAIKDDDGIKFDIDSIETELIKEDAEYEGVRVHLAARLEQARVARQTDIGFGDAVTPEPVVIQFPTILNRVEAPDLRIYPAEVVIAEKCTPRSSSTFGTAV